MPRAPLFLPVLALLAVPVAVRAAGFDELFNSPVLYLDLKMSLDASRDESVNEYGGTMATKMTLHREIDGVLKLDMRSPGATISLMAQVAKNPASINPQEIIGKVDKVASWQEGAPAGLDSGDAMRRHWIDTGLHVTYAYEHVETRTNMPDDQSNDRYDQVNRLSQVGKGIATYSSQIKVEIDRAANKLYIPVPATFINPEGNTDGITETSDSKTTMKKGGEPEVTHETHSYAIETMPRELAPVEKSVMGDVPLVIDGFTPSGALSGKGTVAYTFRDGDKLWPATLTVNYTITTTPPAKGSAAKKG